MALARSITAGSNDELQRRLVANLQQNFNTAALESEICKGKNYLVLMTPHVEKTVAAMRGVAVTGGLSDHLAPEISLLTVYPSDMASGRQPLRFAACRYFSTAESLLSKAPKAEKGLLGVMTVHSVNKPS